MTVRFSKPSLPRPTLQSKPSQVASKQVAPKALQSLGTPRAAGRAPQAARALGNTRVNTSSFEARSAPRLRLGSPDTLHPESVRRELAADKVHARLVADPPAARALDSLGVKNGAGLRSLGATLVRDRLALQPEKKALLDKLQKDQPKLHEKLVSVFRSFGAQEVELMNAVGDTSATPAADALSAAQSVYDDAKSEVDQLDQQLASDLAYFGPTFTDEQRQQYIDAFHTQHPEYATLAEAEDELASALMDPALNQEIADNPQLGLAYAAGEAAQSLAGSTHSVEVLEWAAQANEPSNPAYQAFQDAKEPGVVMVNGLPITHDALDFDALVGDSAGAAATQLAMESGSAEEAYAAFESLVKNVKGLNEHVVGPLLESVQQAASGNLSALDSFSNASDSLGRGLGAASLVFASLNVGKGISQEDYLAAVNGLATASSEGARITAQVLHSFADAFSSARARGVAETLEFLVPGLSAVANAIQVVQSTTDFLQDPSLGGGITVVGDLIALGGSLVGTVLPGVGHVLEAVGLVLSAIGSALSGDHAEQLADRQAALEAMGFSEREAHAYARVGSQALESMAGELDMSPRQIQQLLQAHPELFEDPSVANLVLDMAEAAGLEGNDVRVFINNLERDQSDYVDALGDYFTQLNTNNTEATQEAYHGELLAFLQNSFFPEAYEYLRENTDAYEH